MRILVLGSTGQLGQEFKYYAEKYSTTLPRNWDWFWMDKNSFNLLNLDQLKSNLENFSFDVLINCAAYTAVDLAQSSPEKEICMKINFHAPEIMAMICKKKQSRFIHFSTDYVFDGTNKGKPYQESDITSPLNHYGTSKLLGEKAIQNIDGNYDIFRTSWIYGSFGKNFAKTITCKILQKELLQIVTDQTGTPTWSFKIVESIIHLLQGQNLNEESHLFHLSQLGNANWYDFGCAIYKLICKRIPNQEEIFPILSAQLNQPAKRPECVILDKTKWITYSGLNLQDWNYCLETHFHEQGFI
ncbi:MAG: dTDP-4-dehydrorhamnose reductase [Bacteriovoracaceae bacterium]|nr:dTDP-4-dehydrorhamnose reductase [Bacteriovoracaceae bacterium]